MVQPALPFVKWAGGKRQVLKQLRPQLPLEWKEGDKMRYVEPFVGGGAMLFDLLKRNMISEAYISDTNGPLILTYNTIKRNWEGVVDILEDLQNDYDQYNEHEDRYEMRKTMYFELRDHEYCELTKRGVDPDQTEDVCRISALVIYFNKVGFNGIYRVNSNGKFNVPPSTLMNMNFVNRDELEQVSNALKDVEIEYGDYESCRDFVGKDPSGTFIYFDPPYLPLIPTSFTSYSNSKRDFSTESAHEALAIFASKLCDSGAMVMVSNSDPNFRKDGDRLQRGDDGHNPFFEEKFQDRRFKITLISARRSINSKGDGRGVIGEIVMTRYPTD